MALAALQGFPLFAITLAVGILLGYGLALLTTDR
jgi:hypothetical protein